MLILTAILVVSVVGVASTWSFCLVREAAHTACGRVNAVGLGRQGPSSAREYVRLISGSLRQGLALTIGANAFPFLWVCSTQAICRRVLLSMALTSTFATPSALFVHDAF